MIGEQTPTNPEATTEITAETILWAREFGRREGIASARNALTEARKALAMWNMDVSFIDAALAENGNA